MNSGSAYIRISTRGNFNHHGSIFVIYIFNVLILVPASMIKPAQIKLFSINGNIGLSKPQIPHMGFIIVVTKSCGVNSTCTGRLGCIIDVSVGIFNKDIHGIFQVSLSLV